MSVNFLPLKGTNVLVFKVKSQFKGQKIFKFDLGLLNAFKLMYSDRNINEKKD